jgi:HEAT repeat protein
MKRAAYVLTCIVVLCLAGVAHGQVPLQTLIRITKAEDERRWDADLRGLLSDRNAAIRKRAVLAAGRIGDEGSVAELAKLLKDSDAGVRAMAAFALGEVESPAAADALIAIVKDENERGELRARALEALGKIAGALPTEQEPRQRELGAVIRQALEFEANQSNNRLTVLLGLTAALRARPADAGPTLAKFISSADSRIRSDAANALARLRLKDGNEQLRKLLTTDADPNVRANAARVLGATEDKASFDAILKLATSDPDSRVRVSAIRALAPLKDPRAAETLLKLPPVRDTPELLELAPNELLEIATTLGRLLALKEDPTAIAWLRKANEKLNHSAPEVEIAYARIAPAQYLSQFGQASAAKREVQEILLLNWRAASAVAAGLGEIAALPDSVKTKPELAAAAETLLRALLDYRNSGVKINTLVAVHSENAIPDVLRALAAFKPKDLQQVLIAHLADPDVIVRGTAADLLGDLPQSE